MTIREKVGRCYERAWEKHIERVTAQIISNFLKIAAEDGWHMRPDKATEEMVGVVVEACRVNGIEIFREDEDALPDVVWNAMLAAAPKFEWDK